MLLDGYDIIMEKKRELMSCKLMDLSIDIVRVEMCSG